MTIKNISIDNIKQAKTIQSVAIFNLIFRFLKIEILANTKLLIIPKAEIITGKLNTVKSIIKKIAAKKADSVRLIILKIFSNFACLEVDIG